MNTSSTLYPRTKRFIFNKATIDLWHPLTISLLMFLFAVVFSPLHAQPVAGPAGVGNTMGTDGQPRLALWLDASALSLIHGADVSNWTDISGNNRHATQATTLNMPVFVGNMINGRPGVRFRPTTPFPTRPETFLQYDGSHFVGNPYAIFAVAARRTTSGFNFILGGSASTANQNLHFGWRNASNFTQAQFGNDVNGSPIPDVPNVFSIISSSRNLSSTPFPRDISMDGQVLTLTGSTTNTIPLAAYPAPYIGRYQSSYSQLDLAELIQYSSFLNRAQQIIIENYLSLRYNISIGGSSFYTHSTYTHDLVGIGSSDGAQKHSASSRSSGGLWLREFNNSLNEASEFVFLAHDNTAPGETTSDLPAEPHLQARSSRNWNLQRTTPTTTQVSLGFDLATIGLTPGAPNQVYYLLFRPNTTSPYQLIPTALGMAQAGVVWINVDNTVLQTGYFTLARSSHTGKTWYSYTNGNWDNWQTWTIEQGGTDIVNPGQHTPTTSPTAQMDRVVINAGHHVDITTNGKQNLHLDVNNGILNVGTTTGHLFPTLSGSNYGTIRLAADNFPGGNAEQFHAATGGTVEYNGNGYELLINRNFNNVRINLADVGSRITLRANYHLKGNLTVERGNLQINDDSSTQILNLDVDNNLEVTHQGSITVGQGNTVGTFSIPSNMPAVGLYHSIFHQVRIGGNLLNHGTIRFTNQTAPHYGQFTTTGAATLVFDGFTHAQAQLHATTDLYNLVVDKGVDQTFVLEINSHNNNNFRLFGPNNVGRRESAPFTAANPEVRKALWIRRGTLKLTGSILIPSLSEGNQAGGNGDFAIPATGALLIAGPNVRVFTTAVAGSPELMPGSLGITDGTGNQALSLLGNFRITDGFFSTRNSAGFIFWNATSATVEIAGGVVDAAQFRTTATATSTANTTFIMSGGELLVRGTLNNFVRNGITYITAGGEPNGSFPIFGMVDSLGVFIKSGGIIAIYRTSGNNTFSSNALYINTRPANHNVTGGTIELIGLNETQHFDIVSTGNLFNLTLHQTGVTHTTFAYMGTDLHLEGTLNLLSRTELFSRRQHGSFRDRSFNLAVSQGFLVNTNAQYHALQNTTTLLTRGISTASFLQTNPQFYNLVVRRHPNLPSTRRTLLNNAILVLNNLTIEEGAVLRHVNQDITVRGNIVNSGTIEHDNIANTGHVRVTQRGIVRQINITSAGSHTAIPTITLSAPPTGGVQATAVPVFNGVPAVGNALPLIGILITNPGAGYTTAPTVTITSGGASATAIISTTHEIGGNGQGVFANLLIDEPHPTPISTRVTILRANQRVTKTMTLANGILDLETFNLDIEGTLSDNTIAYYSNTRMFRTAGNHSDRGLTRTISADGTYLFPIGTRNHDNSAERYAWANPAFSGVTTGGKVQINGVPRRLPTLGTATPESFLRYYWRVRSSGFATTPSVVHNFFSVDADYIFGTGTTFSDLRVGKVINNIRFPQAAAPDIGVLQNPDLNQRILHYNSHALETGEFTAARNAMFDGTVLIYYTRDHGSSIGIAAREPRWRDHNTWTRSDLTGFNAANPHLSSNPAVPSGHYPRAGDIAVIGWVPWNDLKESLRGQPHGVWIDGTQETVAKVQFTQMRDAGGNPRARFYRSNFQFRPTLCINGDLGQLTAGWVEGEGMFWVRIGDPNMALMDLGDFARLDSAYIVYENFTTGTRTYNNLPAEVPNIMFANNGWGALNHNITLANNLTTNGNLELLGNINLLLNTGTAGDLNIGRDLVMLEITNPVEGSASGGGAELAFQNTGTPRSVTILGNIRLNNSGGLIGIRSAGTSPLNHNIFLHGSIIQNTAPLAPTEGIRLFSTSINHDRVHLHLLGTSNQQYQLVSGTPAEFYSIILNKGTNSTPRFTFNSPFQLLGPTDGATKALQLQNGTLVLNHPGINITLSSGGADFLITSTTALLIHGGTARITTPGSNGILLDGLLEIRNSASALILDGGVGSDNYIQYCSSGNAVIRVVGGTLDVGSQIRGCLLTNAGRLRYHQLEGGGTSRVFIGRRGAPRNTRGVFEIHNAGSNFQFLNGTITLFRGHDNPATATRAALYLHPSHHGINELGRFILGDSTTTTTLGINAGIELPTVEVTAHTTARTQLNHLSIFGDLILRPTAVLDGNQLNLTVRRNFINHGQPLLNTDTLFMLSREASNFMEGSFTTGNLVLAPTTNLHLFASTNLTINGNLHIASGTFEDRGRQVEVRGHVRNDGSHISEGAGRLLLNGSTLQHISGHGQFGPLELNNAAGAILQNDINLNNTLTLTQGIFNLCSHTLNMGQHAQIVGSGFSESKMIATSGGFADKGIRRYIPIGVSELLFPIGVVAGGGNKYTPVTLRVSQNLQQGHLRINPVNQPHMTVTGPDVLQYYWTLESEGLNGLNAELKFKYLNSDVRGNEAAYYAGRLVNDGWARFPPEFVNETTDSITFLFSSAASLSGDYTAGINPHLPTQIPVFVSTGSGNWSDITRWSRQGGGEIPVGGPSGHIVQIRPGDVIHLDRFRILSYRTTIDGRIEVGTHIGHNLGRISGTGTLALTEGKLPVGNYSQFLTPGTCNTIEYGGPDSYNIPNLTSYGLSTNTYNNLVIAGGGVKTLPNQTINVMCNLNIRNTSTLQSNLSQRVILHGNLTKEATAISRFDFTNQWLEMAGNSPQTINGVFLNVNDRLSNLQINNPTRVTISGSVFLTSALILSRGVLFTGVAPITVDWAADNAVAAAPGSFVDGRLQRRLLNTMTNPFFPVGKSGRRRDVTLFSLTNGLWTAEYFATNPGNAGMDPLRWDTHLRDVSQVEYWRIDGPSPGSARVRLHYGLQSMVDNAPEHLLTTVVAEWGGGQWNNRGGPATSQGGGNGFVTASMASTFSTRFFTIGTTSSVNPLPIELLSFTGKAQDDAILLEWATASETNNDFFTLERSTNGRDFHIIAVVDSRAEFGFSTQNLYYSTHDLQPHEGINYYRLKQTDFDGRYEYSEVIGVLYQKQQQVSFTLFPNPNRGNSFNIALNNLRPFEQVELQISDLNGRTYHSARYQADNAGMLSAYLIPPHRLSDGIYLVTVSSASGRFVVRMVVN